MTIGGSKSADPRSRIRLGMVGGGQGAFIGAVHRIAARIDDQYELVAGAFSSDADRAAASAAELRVSAERAYTSYAEMAKAEAARADGIEAVAIVTPNHLHAPVASAFLDAGIHVICDKPLTSNLADAEALAEKAEKSGKIFAVTYNYSGYPMVRQARAMIAAGDLGPLRVVQVEYPQGWLTEPVEATGQKQAAWRTDPAQAGCGGSTGDIGTHAYQLACFVTGLETEAVLADLQCFGAGRRLDDNAHVLLRFTGGARGMLWSSQVAPGNENGLRLRVYGTKGGLSWSQEDPNYLWFAPTGGAKRLVTRGGEGVGPESARVTRVPAGHPEGYLEGFATIYAEVARAILAARDDAAPAPEVLYPTILDGLHGMRFVDAVVRSSAAGAVWTGV